MAKKLIKMGYDYDAQIERLTKRPDRILFEWQMEMGIFQFARNNDIPGNSCGCLTQIRESGERFVLIDGIKNESLTASIRNDSRIPKKPGDIKPEHLPVFKEWQLKLDGYRNKTTP